MQRRTAARQGPGIGSTSLLCRVYPRASHLPPAGTRRTVNQGHVLPSRQFPTSLKGSIQSKRPWKPRRHVSHAVAPSFRWISRRSRARWIFNSSLDDHRPVTDHTILEAWTTVADICRVHAAKTRRSTRMTARHIERPRDCAHSSPVRPFVFPLAPFLSATAAPFSTAIGQPRGAGERRGWTVAEGRGPWSGMLPRGLFGAFSG